MRALSTQLEFYYFVTSSFYFYVVKDLLKECCKYFIMHRYLFNSTISDVALSVSSLAYLSS